jgi:hypothetical protein
VAELAWSILRLVVSTAAVACGTWMFFDFASYGPGAYGVAIGCFSVMLAIAAMPWVFDSRRRKERPLSLTAILFGIGSAIMAASYVATPYVMNDCSWRWPGTRSRSSCEFFNWLHSVGGNPAVVAFFAAGAAFFILGGGYLLVRIMRRRGSSPSAPSSTR